MSERSVRLIVVKDKRIAELEQYIKWMHEWTSHIVPTFEVWQKRYK